MEVKVKKLDPEATLPSYAREGDAGMDLHALEDVTYKPGERHKLRTGLAFEVPQGYVGLVWDRSGHSFKTGIKVIGGVLDSGYRGEVYVGSANFTGESVSIKKGQRVAQLLIQPVEQANIVETDELSDTQRGEGGFGSTGV